MKIDNNKVLNNTKDGNLEALKQLLNHQQYSKKDITNTVNTCQEFLTTTPTTPLNIAAKYGHQSCLAFLLDQCGANIDGVKNAPFAPLWDAVENNQLAIAADLLKRGANVNVTTAEGETPLFAACYTGKIDIVKYLIRNYYADVNIANKKGETCLMIACRKGFKDIVEYLDNVYGIDINRTNNDNSTALHYAAMSQSLQTVIFLLDRGANVNAKDSFGNTPLSNAIFFKSFENADHLASLADKKEKIHALELRGTMAVDKCNYDSAIIFWKKSLDERRDATYNKLNNFRYSPLLSEFDNSLVEFTTTKELNKIRYDDIEMRMQSLLIKDRILGAKNHHSANYISFVARLLKKRKKWFDSLKLLICYAVIQYDIDCLSNETLDAFFNVMCHLCHMKSMGENVIIFSLRVLRESILYIDEELTHLDDKMDNSKIANFDASLNIPVQLIGMIMTMITEKTKDRDALYCALKKHARILVKRLNPKSLSKGYTPLHIACQKNSDSCFKITGNDFPNANVISLLLDAGADPAVKNYAGDTPFHTFKKNICLQKILEEDSLKSVFFRLAEANKKSVTASLLHIVTFYSFLFLFITLFYFFIISEK